MNNVMGIILTGGKDVRLKELTENRSSAAIPIWGKYRAIDFALSNMVNSGITKVGVITQYRYRSLMDHLGSGKEWDLDRKTDGLYILPPALSQDDSGWYKGNADAMYNNLTFLRRSKYEYVIIAQGNCIYKMSFDEMLEHHKLVEADITIAYREMNDFLPEELVHLGIMKLNSEGRVEDFQEKPRHPSSNIGSMGIYILKRQLLMSLLEECGAHGDYDFVKDILIKKLRTLKIYGYGFNGYWRNLSTIQMYYRCNMELLDHKIRQELFMKNGKIYTKVKDETPAKYNDEAYVSNSVIADGCIIEGTVQNSVLFRGVVVKRGSVIRNSIVMQGSVVEEEVVLEYAILDKNVVITKGKFLKGDPNWPVTVKKDVIV
jgi:glucose-1-phosphate adenylyltransferase